MDGAGCWGLVIMDGAGCWGLVIMDGAGCWGLVIMERRRLPESAISAWAGFLAGSGGEAPWWDGDRAAALPAIGPGS
jgi:hypothetical protein